MKLFLYSLYLVLLCCSCSQSKTIDITEFSQKDTSNAILIDVRTPMEYAEGHIENAKNINWFDADFEKQIKFINKEQVVYLYCKAGGRSAKAQQKLLDLGYKKVVNLEGGYLAFIAK